MAVLIRFKRSHHTHIWFYMHWVSHQSWPNQFYRTTACCLRVVDLNSYFVLRNVCIILGMVIDHGLDGKLAFLSEHRFTGNAHLVPILVDRGNIDWTIQNLNRFWWPLMFDNTDHLYLSVLLNRILEVPGTGFIFLGPRLSPYCQTRSVLHFPSSSISSINIWLSVGSSWSWTLSLFCHLLGHASDGLCWLPT